MDPTPPVCARPWLIVRGPPHPTIRGLDNFLKVLFDKVISPGVMHERKVRPLMARTADQRMILPLINGLQDDLAVTLIVLPMLIEHARRERYELHGHLPTAPRGEDLSDQSYGGDHADPTGEAVVNFAMRDGSGPDPAFDRRIIAEWTHAAVMLTAVTRRVLNQLPAVTRSVNKGADPTDGRTAEEADAARKGAVLAESACLACDLGVSEVGRLKAGLCHTDYVAHARAGHPDRALWLIDRREYLRAKRAARTGGVAAA